MSELWGFLEGGMGGGRWRRDTEQVYGGIGNPAAATSFPSSFPSPSSSLLPCSHIPIPLSLPPSLPSPSPLHLLQPPIPSSISFPIVCSSSHVHRLTQRTGMCIKALTYTVWNTVVCLEGFRGHAGGVQLCQTGCGNAEVEFRQCWTGYRHAEGVTHCAYTKGVGFISGFCCRRYYCVLPMYVQGEKMAGQFFPLIFDPAWAAEEWMAWPHQDCVLSVCLLG